jgi:hypothetical protein
VTELSASWDGAPLAAPLEFVRTSAGLRLRISIPPGVGSSASEKEADERASEQVVGMICFSMGGGDVCWTAKGMM